MALQLPYTLQTHFGMVTSNGGPRERRLPSSVPDLRLKEKANAPQHQRYSSDLLAKALPDIHYYKDRQGYSAAKIITDRAAEYVADADAFGVCSTTNYPDRRFRHFAANLGACTQEVASEDLKEWIQTRTRFDLEQAAAVVVAALRTDGRMQDAARLVTTLGSVLSTSCMWVEPYSRLPTSQVVRTNSTKLSRLLQSAAASRNQTIPPAGNLSQLLSQLMRVRRCKPADRCLHLPEWLFIHTGTKAPEHFRSFFTVDGLAPQAPMPGCHPISAPRSDSIILSRKHFRGIQRVIFRMHPFWKRDVVLRKSIRQLEENVLFASSWIEDRVFATRNVALICHYFFHFQRRLQRRVVSDVGWTGFLAKGEGGKVYQNNMGIKSTFEDALLEIAESGDEGVVVAMGDEDTMALIDQTCLLMKEYVDVYGSGKTANLTFTIGVSGGSGRGPVDEYNLLCDILKELRTRARDEGVKDVPGPVHKFLAKDIMAYNNSWQDDAFAGNKRAGWQDWIEKRRLLEKDKEDEWEAVGFEGELDEKNFPALPTR